MNSHEVDGPVVVSFGDVSFNLCERDKEEAFFIFSASPGFSFQ